MQNNKIQMTNMYNVEKIFTQSFYIIRKSKIDEQNCFVLANGTGHVFAYRNLLTSVKYHV